MNQRTYSQLVVTALINGATVLIALTGGSLYCHAQALPLTEPITVNVQVETKPEPKKAIGLVLS